MSQKKIRTVLGDVDPSTVGVILPHEHLSLDLRNLFYTPPSPQDADKELLPYTMDNLWWIRQHPNSHIYNLNLRDEEQALIEELHFFKKNGGSCIVDNSSRGIVRNLSFTQRAAKECGVHIVAGTGYYVDASHPSEMDTMTEEALVQVMVTDLMEGLDGIKCGVIGEVGCTWPLTANEKKVLRATAQAQAQTGCPVIIHPGRDHKAPGEIVRVLQEAGGNLNKTIMSHLDRTFTNDGELIEFARTGCICELDLFGIEVSHYRFNLEMDMPSDAERIRRIKVLVDEGFGDKVTMAHDVHTKHRIMKFGGHGYSHILLNVVPKMRQRGFTEDVIQKIIVENPKQWLQF